MKVKFHELLERMHILYNIEKNLQSKVITIYRNPARGIHGRIDEEAHENFKRAIDTIGDLEPLILIIDSRGGISYYGWRMASYIMNRSGNTVAVIPEEALSAASLIAISCNSMVMFNGNAQLSPVDPHYQHGELWVSALALLDHEDPVVVAHARRAIEQTETNIRRLCRARLTRAQLDQLVERLLTRDRVHPDHASSIFPNELAELGLPVEVRTQMDVRALHEAYRRHIFHEHDPAIIIEYADDPIPKDRRTILEEFRTGEITLEEAERLLRISFE